MKAEHLPDREEGPADRPAPDHEELGPADGPGDGLARREGPHLDADARRVVPVVRPLEPDVLAKRAGRVGCAGAIESITTECPEAFAAFEDAEGHAFASGRVAFEPGNGDQRRSLAALERLADSGSRLHVTEDRKRPCLLAGPLAVPDRTLLQELAEPGIGEVDGECSRRHPQGDANVLGLSARDL